MRSSVGRFYSIAKHSHTDTGESLRLKSLAIIHHHEVNMNENYSTSQTPPVPPVHPVPPVPPVLPVPPKKSRKRLYITLGTILFVIIVISGGPCSSKKEVTSNEPIWSGTTYDLWELRSSNEMAFEKQYVGQVVEVSGTVTSISDGNCGFGSSSTNLHMIAYFDEDVLMRLSSGMKLKVRAIVDMDHYGLIHLRDCVILDQ